MKKSLLGKIVCPFDHRELHLNIIKEDQLHVIEGVFTCADCNRYYPIIHGVPIFSPDEYREKQLEQPLLERWGYQVSSSDKNQTFTGLLEKNK